ncbi:MAG: phosphate acetyltransferase [Desulfovibrionaceae bacterium]|nr:phosphate acetyltransferase [Desulfovibrionaceae bacterium]
MKSNALSILAAGNDKTLLAVTPHVLQLVAKDKKSVAVVAAGSGLADKLKPHATGATIVACQASDLVENFKNAQSKHDFVLVVAEPSADEANVLACAKVYAELKAPTIFALDATQAKDLKAELGKWYAALAPCGVYLLSSIILGQKVEMSCCAKLNALFSKQDEAPIYFIPKTDVTAEDFAMAVDTAALADRLSTPDLTVTPGLFELELADRARQAKQRIVLAEGEEERILKAADVLLRQNIADIILLGQVDVIKEKAQSLNLDISKATLINPKDSPKLADYANTFYELRKSKGVTEEDAKKTMLDATSYGTMMVKKGDADGMVSGAINTTAHTIRPALQFIKTKPGFSVVSSCFLMCLKDRVLVFGDCAVNPNPTAEQLAEIAVITAQTAKAFGVDPKVAMLSYSTGNSGKGPDVDLVVEATKLAREKDPQLVIDGPLQYDAAFDPTVAKTKMPNSPVAGQATVFIFPNLTCGNNTYKAVQRAANAIAIGPVLQGLNKPVNDLSRGCLVPDIINTVAITAIQAAQEKKA